MKHDYEEAALALSDVAYLLESSEDLAQSLFGLDLAMLSNDIVKCDVNESHEFIRTAADVETFPVFRAVSLLGIVAEDREYLAEYATVLKNLPRVAGLHFREKPPERPAGWRRKTAAWGREFLVQFAREFRRLVCEDKGVYAKIKREHAGIPQAVAAAATTAAIASLGVSGPMALGVATLAVLSVTSVTKNAFCKSTEAEVLQAIDEKLAAVEEELAQREAKK